MKNILISVLLGLSLTACSATIETRIAAPVVTVRPVAVYPVYSDAYYWDPRLNVYFFWRDGNRFYMPRGWVYGSHNRGYHGNHHRR